MMLLYITFIDFGAYFAPGVHRKILGQISAMERKLGKAYYTGWSYPRAFLMSGREIVETEPAVTWKDYIGVLIGWIQKYGVMQTYIRYSISNKWFIDLLEYQKAHQVKTVLEIATFPYDFEMSDGPQKTEDMCYRSKIYKHVGRIATYSTHQEIWGMPCFNLLNGINIMDNPLHTKRNENKKIVFIAVSSMHYWHGYERFLKGMRLYYEAGGKYDLKLKLVGSGPEDEHYMDLAEEYGIQTRVEFVGRIGISEKEKLDQQYNLSDMAVGPLGGYRQGLADGSPIKCAEYCARGVPFICGYRDLRFPTDWEFMLNVPNNPDPIDMNRVIDFYEKVTSKENYKQIMRDYAVKNLSWDKIMEPVVGYFIQG